jgi:hypothetical protein
MKLILLLAGFQIFFSLDGHFNNLKFIKEVPIKNQVWSNKTYKTGINTVLIHKKGWELSFPIINLDSDEKIVLSFDQIGTLKGDYSWSLIHCNANWEKDELNSIEFISGFDSGDITETAFSQNTITNYINYSLEIPNKKSQLLKSGNYLIKVFERNNPEQLVLTRRFYVSEPIAEVWGKIDQLKVNTNDGLNQRLNLKINCNLDEINNPEESLLIKVSENQGFEKIFQNLRPSAIAGNSFRYENLSALCFAAGNEYRHFDIKSIKFLSDRLQNIEKNQNENQIFLKQDENRFIKDYNFNEDINGRKTIKLENSERSNIMADYCKVYFQLEGEIPIEKGDYYIYGAISDWQFDDQCKMTYDYGLKKFTAQLFVKQGYYNYLYIFKSNDALYNNDEFMYKAEGNHFQTENDYHVLVYYKDISSGFDRLIAYNSINSVNSSKY